MATLGRPRLGRVHPARGPELSDLSRLRARLARIEKRGKALKREITQEREDLEMLGGELTRSQERRIQRLESELDESRKDWRATWDRVRREERRLLDDPAGFLRFT